MKPNPYDLEAVHQRARQRVHEYVRSCQSQGIPLTARVAYDPTSTQGLPLSALRDAVAPPPPSRETPASAKVISAIQEIVNRRIELTRHQEFRCLECLGQGERLHSDICPIYVLQEFLDVAPPQTQKWEQLRASLERRHKAQADDYEIGKGRKAELDSTLAEMAWLDKQDGRCSYDSLDGDPSTAPDWRCALPSGHTGPHSPADAPDAAPPQALEARDASNPSLDAVLRDLLVFYKAAQCDAAAEPIERLFKIFNVSVFEDHR